VSRSVDGVQMCVGRQDRFLAAWLALRCVGQRRGMCPKQAQS
jgi:hypothetical protein